MDLPWTLHLPQPEPPQISAAYKKLIKCIVPSGTASAWLCYPKLVPCNETASASAGGKRGALCSNDSEPMPTSPQSLWFWGENYQPISNPCVGTLLYPPHPPHPKSISLQSTSSQFGNWPLASSLDSWTFHWLVIPLFHYCQDNTLCTCGVSFQRSPHWSREVVWEGLQHTKTMKCYTG